MPDGLGELLGDSLAAIRRDAPACARAIAGALGPTVVAVTVDGDRVVLGPGAEIAGPDACAAPDVEVATTARALLALLDGHDELYPALVDNRVRVRAAPHDAGRLFDAMRWFVEGCARTRAAPALLAAYRGRVERTARRQT